MAEQKTNVMRTLEQKKIKYSVHSYPHDGSAVDGVTVAAAIGAEPASVYKTLVTRGASNTVYVFDIPVDRELDLKKAAKAAGEKSVSMIRADEITALTGYVRGGCSPIGMKKQYRTFIYTEAQQQESIVISAGKIGWQVRLAPHDLMTLCRASFADICTEV